MLRDRLVCGTSNEKIKKRLLSEPKLTLKRALELALSSEMAEKDMADLNKASKSEENVHKLQINKFPKAAIGAPHWSHRNPMSRKTNQCSRCNGPHESSSCFQKHAKYYSCGRKGHVSRSCKKRGVLEIHNTHREPIISGMKHLMRQGVQMRGKL